MGAIKDLETRSSFDAFQRLQISVRSSLYFDDSSAMQWEDFLVLHRQLKDATDELYYSVAYDPEELVPAPGQDDETNEFLRDVISYF